MTSRGVTTIPIFYIDIDGTIYETQNEYENSINNNNNNNHDVEESRIRLANILRTRKQQQQQQQQQGTPVVSTGAATTATATATAKALTSTTTTNNNVKRDDRKIKGKGTKAVLSSLSSKTPTTNIETDIMVSNTPITNNLNEEKQHSLVENVDSCSDNSRDDDDDDIINDDDENDYEEDLVDNNEEYDNNNNNNNNENDEYEWCSDDDDNDDEGDDDYNNDDEDYDEDDSDVESNTNLLSQYHPQQKQQVGMYTNDHHHNGSVMLQSDNHQHPSNMTSRSRMMLESNKQRYVTSLIQRDQQLKMNQSLARTAIRNMRPNRGNSTKALPSQFVYQPSPADNAAARAIVHHTGSHYHMAGSKQYQRGVRVKGVVSRHSKQGAKIQAARMAKKNMYDAREDARGERTPNSNKNNNQMKQSKKNKKNKNQTTNNDKAE